VDSIKNEPFCLRRKNSKGKAPHSTGKHFSPSGNRRKREEGGERERKKERKEIR
jgi:hypothetical protein